MVEKYEQMLTQDPTSTVFVELARAYLERGDNDKAITLCQQGCVHHPSSVVGRVLWGKGLINVGRAAEAMKQFDLATNIDKENPHAYNLIGEVLLRKGLYRSALPILRKAATLQPNDGRITQWLEQTRAALAGGPAPVLYDNTTVDTRPIDEATGLPIAATAPPPSVPSVAPLAAPAPANGASPSAPRLPLQPAAPSIAPITSYAEEPPTTVGLAVAPIPSLGDMPAAAATSPRSALPSLRDLYADHTPHPVDDMTSEPTVIMQAYVPEKERERAIAGGTELSVTTEIPTATSRQLFKTPASGPMADGPRLDRVNVEGDEPPLSAPLPELSDAAAGDSSLTASQQNLPVVMGQAEPEQHAEAPDPFEAMMPASDRNETFRGLTSTFEALEQSQNNSFPPVPPSAPRPVSNLPVLYPVGQPAPVAAAPPASSATPAPTDGLAPIPAASVGLLADIVSAQSEIPTGESRAMSSAPVSIPSNRGAFGGGLLDDIPDVAPVATETHRPEFSSQATEAIAKEYERELRAKLEAHTKKKTFLQ